MFRHLARLLILAVLAHVSHLPLALAQTSPAELLREASKLSQQRTDSGDSRTTDAMRLGATFRMAGLKVEAKAALEACAAMVAKDGNPDNRDETKVELAREFLLLGEVERAYALASELKEREYDLLAYYIFARDGVEKSDTAAAERAIRKALEIARRPGRKIDLRMGSSLLCAIGRAASAIKRPELARECEDLIPDPVWKSALTGDRANAILDQDYYDWDSALKVAAQAADPHMAVLTLARIESRLMISENQQSQLARFRSMIAVANKIKDADKRDFALRIAAGKIAARSVAFAEPIATEIKQPAARFLAMAPYVTEATYEGLTKVLAKCESRDQPALAEVLVVSCGKHNLPQLAFTTAERAEQGWPRVRALCAAVSVMSGDGTEPILAAAIGQVQHIADAGWRCVARSQIALAAHRANAATIVTTQLEQACREALQLESADDRRAVLPQVIEAALDCRQQQLAATTLQSVDFRSATSRSDSVPDHLLRDSLVPLFVDAGQADAALKEVAAAPLENDYAKRFLIYRLAKTNRVADAVKLAESLNPRLKSAAFCDIARAQLPDVAPSRTTTRRVALSLHGGWFYWPNRLERAGIEWDVMPFNTPFEEGAAGLAARYVMLGYPGAGDHLIQCSPIGLEHVRRFLRDGGGLFGICAGQLFATGHPNGHRFVPADFYYLRGNGPHQVQMPGRHPAGPALPPQVIINRQNGDFMIPRPGCDVIGWYDNQNECAAVLASHYGRGRVVVSSPHPEGDNSFSPTDRLCIEVTRWIMEGSR